MKKVFQFFLIWIMLLVVLALIFLAANKYGMPFNQITGYMFMTLSLIIGLISTLMIPN